MSREKLKYTENKWYLFLGQFFSLFYENTTDSLRGKNKWISISFLLVVRCSHKKTGWEIVIFAPRLFVKNLKQLNYTRYVAVFCCCCRNCIPVTQHSFSFYICALKVLIFVVKNWICMWKDDELIYCLTSLIWWGPALSACLDPKLKISL